MFCKTNDEKYTLDVTYSGAGDKSRELFLLEEGDTRNSFRKECI